MAKASHETSFNPELAADSGTDFALQFLYTLGPVVGPEAYLHMTAIIEMLGRIPDPELVAALQSHIEEHGINRELIVAESNSSIIYCQ